MSKVQELFRMESLDVIREYLTNSDPEMEYWLEAEMNHRDLDPTAYCCRWLETVQNYSHLKGDSHVP